jgi:DNA polymerase-3 subunit alpha
MGSFVHVHTHSEYSLLDGAARVVRDPKHHGKEGRPGLVDRAAELGMPALALTDHGFMYGAVDFYRAAVKAGIKPILGCEVYFRPERQLTGGKPTLYHLLLLARNDVGYRNLMAIVSDAATNGFYYKPQVDLQLLEKHAEGLIGTSACMSGVLSKSIELGDPDEARRWAETYAVIFAPGDFYVELQEQGLSAPNGVTQRQINVELARIAGELGLPTVATNDIHYIERVDAETQDLLLCIGTGSVIDAPGRMKFSCDEFYMKTYEEMAAALPEYPEALANTLEIAEKCNVSLDFNRIILPAYTKIPAGDDGESYLRKRCMEGLVGRYGDPIPDEVIERLESELAVINEKGFAPYFLIVSDFTQWARTEGIGVGPGRGSAAGSVVAYSLGITNLDPIANGLLFERFLSSERTEMPDIDMDFDDERRGDVIDYVRQLYGEDHVAQIITFGTLKARQAIRDAGRVLGYPFGVPDRISKMIPAMPLDITVYEALYGSDDPGRAVMANPELLEDYECNPDTKRILDAAMNITGIKRNEGMHAAGVVISPDPLYVHLPVKKDTKGGAIITQWDGPTVADLGLLKMDFLGLRTLTVIAKAVRAIEEHHGVVIDVDDLPMDDARTWSLLQDADTDGVFQLESAGMKRVLRDLKPTCYADLVAVVALYRPGPMDSIGEFVARKHGRSPISYYDERLRYILQETYGLIVYQEQVMRISMEMAGFTAAKADKLRKGMGKKIQEVMDALYPEFMEGAVARSYDRAMAQRVWDDVAKFAQYAFNKSHAAAYGMIAYQTAYLKAHYPLEFMAAVLTSHTGKTETIVKYVAACNAAGMKVLPPDVNSSGRDFTAVGDSIAFGLAGIRNVGEGVVETIVAERKEQGPFLSLHDFCNRIDMRQANRKTIESLVKAGAFDSTGYTRKHLMELMDSAVDAGAKRQKDAANGQTSIFDVFESDVHGLGDDVPPPDGDEWPKGMKLAYEKEMLGIYVSDHPLSDIAGVIKAARTISLGQTDELRDGQAGWFAGIVSAFERIATRAGKLMATFTLEDLEGAVEGVLFPQTYERYREVIAIDAVVRVRAKFERGDRGAKLIVQEVEALSAEGRFERPPGTLLVRAGVEILGNGGGVRFKEILARYPGRDAVEIDLRNGTGTKRLRMADEYKGDGSAPGLHAELKELLGDGAVREA